MEAPDYSIVIPVYNSGAWLTELVSRIEAAMRPLDASFEVILVNDASPDKSTWQVIQELSRERDYVRGFDMLYNVGQFRALLCGLEQCRGKQVITMDDDLQHPPEELPKLVQAMKAHPGVDCVMGEYQCKRHGAIRNLGSALAQKIMDKLYDKPPGIRTTSFRIMTADLAKALTLYRTAHPQLGPLIVRVTKNIVNVPVAHAARPFGTSGYRLIRLVSETLRSVVNASIAPLRFISTIGLVCATAAFIVGVYYLAKWLLGDIGVPGYASLIITIAFFSGMILVSIGVLGEYIGRIVQELTGMPRFTIRTSTDEIQR